MKSSSGLAKALRFVGILFMSLTAAFTIMGGVGTSCAALFPNNWDSMAPLAPYQWLYILYVLITTAIGIVGIRAVVRLIRGNVSKPPFDDLRVRQAFNYAVDRQAIVDVVLLGKGQVLQGPISSSVIGAWPGVEEFGYDFDLEKAKSLMEEAGYSLNAEGVFEKDGEPLELTLYSLADETYLKVTQIFLEQMAALGVKINISQLDLGVVLDYMYAGDFQIGNMGMTYGEADLLYYLYHSSQIGGGLNLSQLNSPELDELLQRTRIETDPQRRQEALNEAQKWIVENAVIIPFYAAYSYKALNKQVQGARQGAYAPVLELDSAYFVP